MASLASQPLISEDEFFASYFGQRTEYLNGELVKKSMIKRLQSRLLVLLVRLVSDEARLGVQTYVDIAMKVAPGRYRAPDLALVERSSDTGQILTRAPLVTIEITSDESMSDLMSRVRDHLEMGVKQVVVADPKSRLVAYADADQMLTVLSSPLVVRLRLPGEAIDLDFDDLFSRLGD
ncbi:MAG: Uma2 family endonuclease [Bryobacteraceae bacterium]|nr:Uma2 family endonuclease [Bryobacteraceae bacterium]